MRSSLWPPRRSRARWSAPLAAASCAPRACAGRAWCKPSSRAKGTDNAAKDTSTDAPSRGTDTRAWGYLNGQDAHDSARAVGHRTELSVGAAVRIARLRRHPSRRHRRRHRRRGCAHMHARADARSTMRCLHASACGPYALTPICLHARHELRQPNQEWRRAGFCRYTAAGLAGRTHATCDTPHATLNMQRAAHPAKSRRAPRRSLPRRCRALACRRVGCRCMCAAGNGRRVTNGLRG